MYDAEISLDENDGISINCDSVSVFVCLENGKITITTHRHAWCMQDDWQLEVDSDSGEILNIKSPKGMQLPKEE